MHTQIDNLSVSAYTLPTEQPESDGTLHWDHTTLVLVEIQAAGQTGMGYTYAHAATAFLIDQLLRGLVEQQDPMRVTDIWQKMVAQVRNNGNSGMTHMAIAAVDTALWDLKAKLLHVPLVSLLGQVRDQMPLYGSGGFTSYTHEKLQNQLAGWVAQGIDKVKMKVGREPELDIRRVEAAREAIGPQAALMVDANGAYTARQALALSDHFAEQGVIWLEEPVSSDDLPGLHFIREHVPAPIQVAAGEYGYTLTYFERMLSAGAVDVVQADATRCGGITGFLKAAVLSEAHHRPFSSHCAPALHLHPALAVPNFYAAEYFHDHVRIEQMLFEGIPQVKNGAVYPDLSRPGLGLEFKHQDARPFQIT